jgi:hypothetical protein
MHRDPAGPDGYHGWQYLYDCGANTPEPPEEEPPQEPQQPETPPEPDYPAWVVNTPYVTGQGVYLDGNYKAKGDHVSKNNNKPPNANFWNPR